MKFQNGDQVLANGQLATVVSINYDSGVLVFRIENPAGGKNDVTTHLKMATLAPLPGVAYAGAEDAPEPLTENEAPYGVPGDELVSTATVEATATVEDIEIPQKRGPGRPRKDQS